MTSPKTTPDTADKDRVEQWLAWARANQRRLTYVGLGLALIGGGIWFAISAKQRRENFARRELDQARLSAEAGNLPLAANDLSRIVSTYRGTRAGEEAELLLAQVRLLENQPELAATELQTFVSEGPREEYRSQAYATLATALEQTGQLGPAAKAYENAANESRYQYVAMQLRLQAGRAFAQVGDTAAAVRVYERVLADAGDTPVSAEARLRLAELRRYEGLTPKTGT